MQNNQNPYEVQSEIPSETLTNDNVIKKLLGSDEFIFATLATMFANIAHNDHNKFQNEEALKILQKLTSQKGAENFGVAIKEIAKFASEKKTKDRNYSYFFDSLRMITAAGIIASKTANFGEKDDKHLREDAVLYGSIASAAAQLCFSAFTSYHGYQASISGHLAEELTNAYKKTTQHLIEKLTPNLSSDAALTLENSQTEEKTHHHEKHAGSLPRNAGTVLNISSMGLSAAARGIQTANNQDLLGFGSTLASAPVASMVGKSLSSKAAKIRKEYVEKSIDDQSADLLQALSNQTLSDEFVANLKKNLVELGNSKISSAQEQRDSASVSTNMKNWLKSWFNYSKDSLYGVSYNLHSLAKTSSTQGNSEGGGEADLESQVFEVKSWQELCKKFDKSQSPHTSDISTLSAPVPSEIDGAGPAPNLAPHASARSSSATKFSTSYSTRGSEQNSRRR